MTKIPELHQVGLKGMRPGKLFEGFIQSQEV